MTKFIEKSCQVLIEGHFVRSFLWALVVCNICIAKMHLNFNNLHALCLEELNVEHQAALLKLVSPGGFVIL